MPEFDPSAKRNWSFQTPITGVADGHVFRSYNFTQASPWTEPFTANGLVFEDCNLTNVLLPDDAIVRVGGNIKTLPELPDGRRVPRQHQYRVFTEEIEVEPGIWENHEIQRRYKVTGTPAAPVETLIAEEDLGPTT
jgi:hypothetical protein